MIVTMAKEILSYPVLKNRRVNDPMGIRMELLQGIFAGRNSFMDFIVQLPPGRYKSHETKIKYSDDYKKWLTKDIQPYCHEDGSVNLYGQRFYPYRNNYDELVLLIGQIIVYDQYQTTLIKDNAVVIDAGGNLGVFAIMVAKNHPSATVYAMEPSADNFALLKKNTAAYPNIQCFNMGLGEQAAERRLHVSLQSSGVHKFDGSTLDNIPLDGGEKEESAKIVTLDSFMAQQGISRFDFLKIDTEGYEAKILMGAAESIKKWCPIIAMSAYHAPNDIHDLPALLLSIFPDYDIELHKEYEEDLICRPKR
jgi:FkbM family methyltransferase